MICANGVKPENVPASMESHLSNIDNKGTSFVAFVIRSAIAALRDGHSFILVDHMPKDETVRSQADYLRSGRRPYWVHYEALDLIHHKTAMVNGREVLTLAVFQESAIVANSDFDETEEVRYRVLRPGSWELWKIETNSKSKKNPLFLLTVAKLRFPIFPRLRLRWHS